MKFSAGMTYIPSLVLGDVQAVKNVMIWEEKVVIRKTIGTSQVETRLGPNKNNSNSRLKTRPGSGIYRACSGDATHLKVMWSDKLVLSDKTKG